MKPDPYTTPYAKTNSKWVKGPDVRSETVRLLEGSTVYVFKSLHAAMAS